MVYRILLRTAAVLAAIHALMHQVGMLQPPADPNEIALVGAMQAHQMDLMGAVRSYLDIYSGMGVFMTLMLVGFAILLWQMAAAPQQSRQAHRPLLLTIALVFLVLAAASIRYFFIAPIVMEGLVAALALLAWRRVEVAAP